MPLDREYKIAASSHTCQGCARRFGVGDEYYSAVREAEGEDVFARHDFCPACWRPDGAAYFSFWKTRVPEPDQPRRRGPQLVDLARLMQLFEHLDEAEEDRALRFRYVLALVLMRKRRLKVVSSRRLAGRSGEELTLRETHRPPTRRPRAQPLRRRDPHRLRPPPRRPRHARKVGPTCHRRRTRTPGSG